MHIKSTTLAVLAATAVAGQDLSGLPACARLCLENNFSASGCDSKTDFNCLCR